MISVCGDWSWYNSGVASIGGIVVILRSTNIINSGENGISMVEW
jgi:hypothetical protein